MKIAFTPKKHLPLLNRALAEHAVLFTRFGLEGRSGWSCQSIRFETKATRSQFTNHSVLNGKGGGLGVVR